MHLKKLLLCFLLSTNCFEQKSEKAAADIDGSTETVTDIDGNTETVTDIDGNVYTTVKIGEQIWTVENLNTTKFNNGEPITLVTKKWQWEAYAEKNEPVYYIYDWYDVKDSNNVLHHNTLYNWFAVNSGKLAPKGWHVPTDDEWDELKDYLIVNGYNWDGSKEGNKIGKALAANTSWRIVDKMIQGVDVLMYGYDELGAIGKNLNKNNASGFTALPSVSHNYFGLSDIDGASWWSSTEINETTAYSRQIFAYGDQLLVAKSAKSWGYCVRLIKNK